MASIASTDRLRRHNSLIVMQSLRHGAALSHTDIAEKTGLASATVSAITTELLNAGYVSKLEQAPAQGRGRPRVLFEPRGERGFVSNVILSSDAASFSLLDFRGKLLDRFSEPRRGESNSQALLSLIEQGVQRQMGRSKINAEQLLHIGISSKGLIDQRKGRLLWSPIIADTPVDITDELSARFALPVAVYNETALVAQAIWQQRIKAANAEPSTGLVALSLGHNIGLGIARAKEGTSSEPEIIAPNFGHMLHVAGGAKCRCGARGCVEAYSGFYAILRTAFEVPETTVPANFVPIAEVEKIAALARSGDRHASFAFRQAGLVIGNGLGRLFSLYGVMPVYIGGLGTRFFDLMNSGVKDGLQQSSVARFGTLEPIHLVSDEAELLAEGHRSLALAICDGHLLNGD